MVLVHWLYDVTKTQPPDTVRRLFVVGALVLCQVLLLQQGIDLVGAPQSMVNLAVLGLAHCREFD